MCMCAHSPTHAGGHAPQLECATIVDAKACLEDVQKDHCFGIVTAGRTYYMYSENAAVTRDWVRCLTAVARLKPGDKLREASGGTAPRRRDDDLEADRVMERLEAREQATTKQDRRAAQASRFLSDQGAGHSHSHSSEFRRLRDEAGGGRGGSGGSGSGAVGRQAAPADRSGMDAERLKTRVHKLLHSDRSL